MCFRDSSGQNKYILLSENFFRGSQAALCCFDINDRESFRNVGKWIKLAKEKATSLYFWYLCEEYSLI